MAKKTKDITIGVSNKHVHLTQEDFEKLFGEGAEMEKEKDITQPGQYASTHFVTIKTPKAEIEKVRVLGPPRSYSQVEISRTEAYKLGLNPPVRDSGNVVGSEKITIVGPKGEIEVEGCIIARRHVHITPEDKEKYQIPDMVRVRFTDGERGGVFENVFVKASDPAYYELHVDTDEGNAFEIKNGCVATIEWDD